MHEWVERWKISELEKYLMEKCYWSLERWLSDEEHVLLLQRIQFNS